MIMKGEGLARLLFRFAWVVQGLTVAVGVSAQMIHRVEMPPDWETIPDVPGWYWHLVHALKQHTWWITISCFVLASLAGWMKVAVGPPKLWLQVHKLLDQFQARAFPPPSNSNAPPLHHNRVTLFQHRPWIWAFCCWPGTGWMVPIQRSGVATRKTAARFRAPDDAERVEGIAGTVWVRSGTIFVPTLEGQGSKLLPAIKVDAPDSRIDEYAKRTFTSERWIRRRMKRLHNDGCLHRSFCGFPVTVEGKPWGVLVIDSMEGALDPAHISDAFTPYETALSTLLAGR
jgi:hypothetical protein